MAGLGDSLLEQACGGSREALSKLIEKHTPSLLAHLVGRIPRQWQSVLSVEDVLQQTFTDAFLHIGRFMPRIEDAFAPWLKRIADNNRASAITMLEAEKRGGDWHRIEFRSPEDSLVGLYDLVAATLSTPSRNAARREALMELEGAIQRLPEHYRQIVRLRDLEGRPLPEVAQILGRSPGAVCMIRARAHRLLGELLGNASRLITTT